MSHAAGKKNVKAKQLVSLHLADYVSGIEALLKSLVDVSSSANPNHDVEEIMESLVRKDQLLQGAVGKLVEHQVLEHKIASVQDEITDLDRKIISFASTLGDMEQELHDAVTDEKTLKNLDGHITKQPFSVHDVTVLAEKLGQRSFAPADYLEKKGMSIQHRPPQPVEAEMALSRLMLDLDDLLNVSLANADLENTGEQDGEGVSSGLADGMLDPSADASWKGALPTFAEMSEGTNEEWMLASGHQPIAQKRAQLSGLSLNLGDSDEDDFSEDESDDGDNF